MPNRVKADRAKRKRIHELWQEGRGYGSRSKGKNQHGFYTAREIGEMLDLNPSTVYMIAKGER
jgi:hypothetical protein